jgi:PAS domain-containing protein
MDITELKRSQHTLAEQNRKLEDAEEIAQMGHWALDLTTNRLTWSDRCYEIFEVDPGSFGGTYDAFLEMAHPEDRETLVAAYKQSVKDKTPYNIIHRLLMKDGRIKHVNEMCRTEYNADGTPIRSVGVVQDVTRQKCLEASEACYQLLFDTTHNGVAVFKAINGGEDFEFVDMNKVAEDLEQIQREAVIGKRLCDVFQGAKTFGLLDVLQRVWQTGQPDSHTAPLYGDDRTAGWRENQVFKLPTGDVVTIYKKISEKNEDEHVSGVRR